MIEAADLPAGVLAGDELVHLDAHLLERLTERQATVEVDLALGGHGVQRGGDARDVGEHHGAVRRVGLVEAGVQGLDALDDLGHLVDGVLALLGRRAVGRDAVGLDANLRLALVAERDEVAARLADHAEVGLKARVAVEELEVHAVAVLLADGARHIDGFTLEQAGIARGGRGIDARAQTALHVHRTAAPQLAVHDLAAKGIVLPVLRVVDLHGVDVPVEVDDLGAVADAAHGVAGLVDIGLVIAELLHLGHDELGHRAFFVGIAAGLDGALQEVDEFAGHGCSLRSGCSGGMRGNACHARGWGAQRCKRGWRNVPPLCHI